MVANVSMPIRMKLSQWLTCMSRRAMATARRRMRKKSPDSRNLGRKSLPGKKIRENNVADPKPLDDLDEDTIATPEGDGEFAPDQPLAPLDTDITRPRGDEPHP